jgi:hypothetical protein
MPSASSAIGQPPLTVWMARSARPGTALPMMCAAASSRWHLIGRLFPRELAVTLTDECGYFVTQASVYRLLKTRGLITSPAITTCRPSRSLATSPLPRNCSGLAHPCKSTRIPAAITVVPIATMAVERRKLLMFPSVPNAQAQLPASSPLRWRCFCASDKHNTCCQPLAAKPTL